MQSQLTKVDVTTAMIAPLGQVGDKYLSHCLTLEAEVPNKKKSRKETRRKRKKRRGEKERRNMTNMTKCKSRKNYGFG